LIRTNFHDRLNRIPGNTYAIEEKVVMPETHIYEAYLQHDNIDDDTVEVYTGKNLTGDRIGYTLITPSDLSWKRQIRIETNADTVYITYETIGDQVEAEDINEIHAAVIATQNAVTRVEEEITGSVSGYTWNRLMGITPESIIEIVTQPESKTVAANTEVTFDIVASGTDLEYQWQYVEPGESQWRDFTGGTTATLTVTPTAAWNGRLIRCVLSNVHGASAVSTTVTLTVT
jgi:hypothetical protein